MFYKGHAGVKGLSDDDAVEEALCFGWIDSVVRRIDLVAGGILGLK